MNWKTLFAMQEELDNYILAQHHLKDENVFDKKLLALLVEVGELANETRCFKYWSLKPPSKREVILEEYVDGIHFILSIGLELKVNDYHTTIDRVEEEPTELFHQVYEAIAHLRTDPSVPSYYQVFSAYLKLGVKLGFLAEDIRKAYHDKNKINFERQDQGY